jgi:hypothetical protein
MSRKAIIFAAVLAMAGAFMSADDALASVNGRQRRQQARIAQGVRSGELTGREAARLEARERHIRREERRYRADGVLDPWERADLNRDLNRASRDIYRQKHDGATR